MPAVNPNEIDDLLEDRDNSRREQRRAKKKLEDAVADKKQAARPTKE